MRETFGRHGGNEIDTQGDAFFYSFAALAPRSPPRSRCSARHAEQEWPEGVKVNVRLGLHTGEPVVGDEGYTGLDVVRAARIAADGKGGQILLSEATRAIVGGNLPEGVGVRELGERTLKDIDRPEPLFELVYAPEPPTPAGICAWRSRPSEISFDVKPASVLKQWQTAGSTWPSTPRATTRIPASASRSACWRSSSANVRRRDHHDQGKNPKVEAAEASPNSKACPASADKRGQAGQVGRRWAHSAERAARSGRA